MRSRRNLGYSHDKLSYEKNSKRNVSQQGDREEKLEKRRTVELLRPREVSHGRRNTEPCDECC